MEFHIIEPGATFCVGKSKEGWKAVLEELGYHFDKNDGIRKDGAKVGCSECDEHVTIENLKGFWFDPKDEDKVIFCCEHIGCQFILLGDLHDAYEEEDEKIMEGGGYEFDDVLKEGLQ